METPATTTTVLESVVAPVRDANSVRSSTPIEGVLTPRGLATAARVLFLALGILGLAYFGRPVLVPILLAWVASMTLRMPVEWLNRLGISTPLAAGMVVLVFVVGLGFAALRLGRPAAVWVSEAPENLPRLREKFRPILQPAARFTEAASQVGDLGAGGLGTKPAAVEVNDHRVANTVFNWTSGLVAGTAETVALLFLFLASGDLFLQKLVRVTPRLRDKKRVVEITREIHSRISTYLFSVGLINLGFGAVVGLVISLLGMPNAVMWGAVAAVTNFVPYVGPVLGMSAVGLAGLIFFDTLELGLLPAAAFLVLHLIESNAVTPFVLGRRFALNPVIIFVTLIFLLWLWGIVGALLAGPLLVSLKVVCERIPELAFVAELLSPQLQGEAGA